jgi:hypothetical protein
MRLGQYDQLTLDVALAARLTGQPDEAKGLRT